MFRSRQTGRITIAQFPNWSLAIWAIATAAIRLGDPSGWFRTSLVVVAAAALAIWAGDELARGVNPFRRLLGAVVLGGLAYTLIT